VADALVNMIRAGAGIGDFQLADADELIQYAVRRGLINADEGAELLEELKTGGGRPRARHAKSRPKKPAKKPVAKKALKAVAGRPSRKPAKKAAKRR
jgi:hypothetical protein